MKPLLALFMAAALLLSLAACAADTVDTQQTESQLETTGHDEIEITQIVLSDDGVRCDSDAVFTANDIIYYEAGHDETYGAGDAEDEHTADEAAAHTVVHITEPGTYCVTGTLSAGQLFVDLGEDAKDDPEARVTLILDGADITCTVAPAVFFYSVYECADAETYTLTPDLTEAGAVVELADDSENSVNGAYVARIYKEGTEKKLHKYDGAFYSKMSMRIEGDSGILRIQAQNEGLDTELHLEINGGSIEIIAQDDGINTNEDGISVTTLNGGTLTVTGGLGEEGDGIDSNGALVINGGTLYASANPRTGDGGIDADTGIYLNGGTVIATGSRNDTAQSDSTQEYMELTFAQTVRSGSTIALLDGEKTVLSFAAERDFSSLTLSSPELELAVPYTLTVDGVVQQHGGVGGRLDGMDGQPGDQNGMGAWERPNMGEAEMLPTDGRSNDEVYIPEPPGGMDAPDTVTQGMNGGGERPEGGEIPEKPQDDAMMPPDGEEMQKPNAEGMQMPDGDMQQRTEEGTIDPFAGDSTEVSTEFTLSENGHTFSNVRDCE